MRPSVGCAQAFYGATGERRSLVALRGIDEAPVWRSPTHQDTHGHSLNLKTRARKITARIVSHSQALCRCLLKILAGL